MSAKNYDGIEPQAMVVLQQKESDSDSDDLQFIDDLSYSFWEEIATRYFDPLEYLFNNMMLYSVIMTIIISLCQG
jgi:hypothetical protein